jgi:hypothetical protein
VDDEQDEFENYYAYGADQWPGGPRPGDDDAGQDAAQPDAGAPPATDTNRPRGLLRRFLARLFRRP